MQRSNDEMSAMTEPFLRKKTSLLFNLEVDCFFPIPWSITMKIRHRFITTIIASVTLMSTVHTYAANKINDDYESYCKNAGGIIEEMPAQISTRSGMVIGVTKSFCNFSINGGFIAIGLETFSSSQPNIAATMIKKLEEIKKDSALLKGPFANPSMNVCKNLSGSSISFITSGGFANHLGQNDICVFGDGSMVSAWSLIYMANHREGYDVVKNQVRSEPLNINLPK